MFLHIPLPWHSRSDRVKHCAPVIERAQLDQAKSGLGMIFEEFLDAHYLITISMAGTGGMEVLTTTAGTFGGALVVVVVVTGGVAGWARGT
jgi:hypothetical protein